MNYRIDYLRELENEAIYVIREALAQAQKPVILFSGGKDSITLLHLAIKAVYPANLSVPLLHVDTGHNFQETLDFRDEIVKKYNLNLVVRTVQQLVDEGIVQDSKEFHPSRNSLQSNVLLGAIEEFGFDCCFGGGRRDEEKARAKERFFSHRDEFGQWEPKNQRPELWHIYNGHCHKGENFRVFPLSNWTELDVWNYIREEDIKLPSLYEAHNRDVFRRDGVIYACTDILPLKETEKVENLKVRFRTIGDISCTGAVESDADTLDKIIEEVTESRLTERGTRADDKRSETAMEDRKKQGYF